MIGAGARVDGGEAECAGAEDVCRFCGEIGLGLDWVSGLGKRACRGAGGTGVMI